MGTKTKLALAGGFVGMVAMAATAFGQVGSDTPPDGSSGGSGTPPTQQQREQRRAERAQRRDERRCDRVGSRRAARLVHSDAKVKAQQGFALLTIDQGEITSISGDKFTIKRLDGKSVTATATDETRVCKDGQRSSVDALKVGDRARLMQVRSSRFTGLRRIMAVTPGAEQSSEPRGAANPASAFGGDEFDQLFDQSA